MVKTGNRVAESQAAQATVIQGTKMMSRSIEALSPPHLGFLTLTPCIFFFFLGDSPASEFSVPTFRNTLSHSHRSCSHEL